MRARVAMVLPDAGGNVKPSLGIGRALGDRGYEVIVLGHERHRAASTTAQLAFEHFVEARAWQPVHDRPGARTLLGWLGLATDPGIGRDVRRVASSFSPDLLVVDCMIPGVLPVAQRLGIPAVMIMHTVQEYWRDQWSWTSPMGSWLRLRRLHPTRHPPALTVVTTLPDLDPGPSVLPRSVQVGPVLGPLGAPSSRNPALPVLVSLSTITYPDQKDVLQRILDAIASLPIRALVTNPTGLHDLRVPPNAQVDPFLPHEQVMPNVGAVVCHGGHGTTMMALAHGVPVLVVPLTRHADHGLVGRAVEAAGAGKMLHKDSDAATLATGITETLAISPRGIRPITDTLRSRPGAAVAAEAIEQLASRIGRVSDDAD